jgi:serine/threonine protein kinase
MERAKLAKPLQRTQKEKIERPDVSTRKQPANIEPAIEGKAPKRGDQAGPWTLERRLGRGGNGEVWLATADGKQVAIKILQKPKPMAYARFRAEVGALKLTAGIRGVLPVLADDLPSELGNARPWYAMPVATPLLNLVGKMTIRAKVSAIAEAADTLAVLHDKKIVHRDIKVANLLDYEGRCHIADFGLVDYPERPDITIGKEQIGPRWTMAPEVRREGTDADAFPADVYSLAKTLWIVLTGEQKGFDGQYHPDSELSIKKYCGELYITPLEELLSEGTDNGQRS